MIVTLDIKTGDVLGVRDSPEVPIGRLAAMFANRTKKIWEAELGKQTGKPLADMRGQANERLHRTD